MLDLSQSTTSDIEEIRLRIEHVKAQALRATSDQEAREISSRIAQLVRRYQVLTGQTGSVSPLAQAKELDSQYRERPHLSYLSSRLVNAVRDVERGQSRKLIVSMPPRSGKSTMTSLYTPLWILRRHPDWSVVLTSYDGALSRSWAAEQRRLIETKPDLGIALKPDAGALANWNTLEGGGMYATSVGGALTGRGARVLIIDDPIADFAAAHSLRIRDNLWNWWLSVASTRLELPYLVLITMTRWHEDDLVGRMLSKEYPGDAREWEVISLPALAHGTEDVLGREEGQPLISPLVEEKPWEAKARWESTKINVGSYTFSSMYQQSPAPQQGAIFDVGWWRYWTMDPSKVTDDGQVMYLDPDTLPATEWLDSWDTAFKGGDGASSFVVGQRWAKSGANRFLIAQQRGRWDFTQTIKKMEVWARQDDPIASPYGHNVHVRLIEEKANGAAIINTLQDKISGLKPINPRGTKESRAYAITPEVESGNVYLPHPTDPGNEWVQDLLSELRNFPHDTNDDQVDTLTQALNYLRSSGRGQITVPGSRGRNPSGQLPQNRNVARAAFTDSRRRRGF